MTFLQFRFKTMWLIIHTAEWMVRKIAKQPRWRLIIHEEPIKIDGEWERQWERGVKW